MCLSEHWVGCSRPVLKSQTPENLSLHSGTGVVATLVVGQSGGQGWLMHLSGLGTDLGNARGFPAA